MTLIASFSEGDCSYILGDLLLSGPEREGQSLHLPSIGDITQVFPKGAGFVPVSLTRKLCHFGNLAVGWAGRYIAARVIIKHLFDEIQRNGPITVKELEKLLQNIDPWILKALGEGDVALLVHLINPEDKKTHIFGVNHSEMNSSLFGTVRMAGSGSSFFRGYFDHTDESGFELPAAVRGSFEATVYKALIVAGMLLQVEIGTGKSLENYFGGGYEVILQQAGRFLLCDALLYTFWYADADAKGVTLRPILKFFKQNYHGDTLLSAA